MQVIRLILEHFKGITSGRGKDRVEVDFSAVDPTVKLLALFGPNGSSKTTIMDNLHPYRVMPSRSSSPTPTSFSYYPQVVEGKDALKDLVWQHKGREFRSVVRIRATGKTNKQECYLTEKIEGIFVPYADLTGLTSDGKTDTYDRAVEAVLGKPEVFFATQFSAQGKKPISTMTSGEVKSLLSSMLTMGSFKSLSEKANEVVKGLKPHLSAYQSQLLPLETKLMKAADIEASLSAAVHRKSKNSTDILIQAQSVESQQAKLGTLRVRASQQASVAAQRDAYQVQLASVIAQNSGQLAQFKSRQASDCRASQEAQGIAAAAVRVARSARENARRLLVDTQLVIDGESVIATAQAFIHSSRQTLAELKAKQTDLYVDDKKFSELTELVGQLRASFAADKSTGVAMVESIAASRAIASLIGEVPCRGHAFAGSCKLLSDANQAARGLDAREQTVVALRSRLQNDQVKLRNNATELQRLMQSNAAMQSLQEQIASLEMQINDAKAVLKGGPALTKAKAQMSDFSQGVVSADNDLLNAVAHNRKVDDDVKTIESRQSLEMQSFMAVLYKEQDRIKNAITCLPVMVGENDLALALQEFNQARATLGQLEVGREAVNTECAELQAMLNDVRQAKAKISQLTLVCDAISGQIAQWLLLSKALGNDGIIAMSIDDAGPEISALCNSLLKDCAGGRFNVSLSTQATTTAGALKEAFLINVEDTIRGEQKELGLMSGGEKVWINECLVRAMALYMSQSTGSDFKTLFSDEADGPLDPERKRQYMAMKRSVLDRGGYEREFIITQTPELLLLCDEVIDVTQL